MADRIAEQAPGHGAEDGAGDGVILLVGPATIVARIVAMVVVVMMMVILRLRRLRRRAGHQHQGRDAKACSSSAH